MTAANFQGVTTGLAVLALIADGLVAVAGVVVITGLAAPGIRTMGGRIRAAISPVALAVAWIASMIATSGSLYLSEIAHLVPCRLCWYQRIVMYPLVLLLGIAVFRDDRRTARRYLIPMAAVGTLLSVYHYQLERFPSQTEFVCSADAPCSVPVVNMWGFASVPFMALAAFLLIITMLWLARSGDDEAGDDGGGIHEAG